MLRDRRRLSWSSTAAECASSAASGSSIDSRSPGKLDLLRASRMLFANFAITELGQRNIEGKREMLWPFGGGGERIAHNPIAERPNEPAFVGRRHEQGGQHLAKLRMVHAHKRLEADQPTAGEIVPRLKMQLEPTLLQPIADGLFHLQPRLDPNCMSRE